MVGGDVQLDLRNMGVWKGGEQ